MSFASDLVALIRPKGTASATAGDFTERYDPDAKGNVLSRTNAEGFVARTSYDARGQVTREEDEVGNVTTYRDFDPSGLPREQTDPRGGVYHYALYRGTTDAKLGSAIQKHQGQGNFPLIKKGVGNPANLGREQLKDILTHPGGVAGRPRTGNAVGGTRIVTPDGRGATFSSNGDFMYFGWYR